LNLDEEVIKNTIKKRKRIEKTKLFIRRIITFGINFFILIGGWILIASINLYDTEIQNWFKKISSGWLEKISTFVPSLCLTLVNGMIPKITKIITNLEKWDF